MYDPRLLTAVARLHRCRRQILARETSDGCCVEAEVYFGHSMKTRKNISRKNRSHLTLLIELRLRYLPVLSDERVLWHYVGAHVVRVVVVVDIGGFLRLKCDFCSSCFQTVMPSTCCFRCRKRVGMKGVRAEACDSEAMLLCASMKFSSPAKTTLNVHINAKIFRQRKTSFCGSNMLKQNYSE